MKGIISRFTSLSTAVHTIILILSTIIGLTVFLGLYGENITLNLNEYTEEKVLRSKIAIQGLEMELDNLISKSTIVEKLWQQVQNHQEEFTGMAENMTRLLIPQVEAFIYCFQDETEYEKYFNKNLNREIMNRFFTNSSTFEVEYIPSEIEEGKIHMFMGIPLASDGKAGYLSMIINITGLFDQYMSWILNPDYRELTFLISSDKKPLISNSVNFGQEVADSTLNSLIASLKYENIFSESIDRKYYFLGDDFYKFITWDEITLGDKKYYMVFYSENNDLKLKFEAMIKEIIFVVIIILSVAVSLGVTYQFIENRKNRRITFELKKTISERTHELERNIIEKEARNSELTQIKDNLEKANRVLEAIFSNTAQSFVILDTDFKIKGFNKVSERTIKSLYGIIPELGMNAMNIVSEHAAPFVEEILKSTLLGKKDTYEMKNTTAEGNEIWSEYHLSPIVENGSANGIFVSFFDITKRKKYETELETATHKLELALGESKLFNDVIETLISTDETEEIFNTICSKLAEYFKLPLATISLFDEDRQNFKIVGEFIKGDIPPALGEVFPLVNNTPAQNMIKTEKPYLIKDARLEEDIESLKKSQEERKFITVLLIPLLMDNEVIGNVGLDSLVKREFSEHEIKFAFNITNSAVTVIKKALLRKQLEDAKEEAENSNKAKSNFLARMSHEFRTPLNGIIGMSEVLSHSSMSKEQHDYIETIKYSADNLLYLINDILDFSKIESGKLQIEKIPIEMCDFIGKIRKMFEALTISKGLKFTVTKPEECPSVLLGDPVRLRQILINLIGNAIKFTKEGEISLKIENLGIDKLSNKIKLRFCVSDTGIGIAKENLDRIFESFEQSDTSITRKFGGTGLGLSICKSLVEMMNGKIDVKSVPDEGSEFSFTLPFEMGEEDAGVGKSESIEVFNFRKPLKILLAEDNPVNRKVFASYLKDYNFAIDFAENGEEAFEKFRQEKYDVVFMDIQMPVMDGYSASKKIREFEVSNEIENVPIIAMTAFSSTEKSKAVEAGMNHYISKPISKNGLLRVLLKSSSPHGADKFSSDTESGIDTLKFMENYGEDREVALEIIDIYLNSSPQNITELSEAVENKDQFSVFRLIHTMKSTYGYFFAHRAFDISVEIEKCSKSENFDRLKSLVKELERENDLINLDLRSIIREFGDNS